MANRIGAFLIATIIAGIAIACIRTWGFAPELLWFLAATSSTSFVLYSILFRVTRRGPVSRLFGIGLLITVGGAVSSGLIFGSPGVFFGLYALFASLLGAFLGLMGSIIGLSLAYATRPKQETLVS